VSFESEALNSSCYCVTGWFCFRVQSPMCLAVQQFT